jgi:hypothetical protein
LKNLATVTQLMKKFPAFISGQAPPQMQPANEPYYYSTVPEYKQNPGAGHTAGSDID